MKKGYLILEDGTVFEGERFGAETSAVGELVFNTGVCGYIETLTDPSYYGQIVLQTFPLIGNYGIIEEDFQGKCSLNGYIVREWCKVPSNFRSQYDLDTYLKKAGVPGLCGLDTREITKIIRERGVMNAMICDELPRDLDGIKNFKSNEAVAAVTPAKASVYPPKGEKKYSVTLIDYGTTSDVIGELQDLGCEVTAVPASTKASDVLATNPDGIMLSNGPGDPSINLSLIEEIKNIAGKKPIFALGLGHQLLALANGARTEKLKYGHRGGNQPVKDVKTGLAYITTQNHGYIVDSDTVKNGTVDFININDNTCEGIDYPELKAFSVQFYPDSSSGPRSTGFLFEKFITLMGGKN
jgi:carbamoyl-phosphate synthase small subunit